ncbi:MAG TPA: 3D domain-containing protein [Candidatus Acidoferrales bacterium]|nr:3D domain-containing protein [Candidatus Acidoferrales bacterium]
MTATAFARARQPTASGTKARLGTVAADPALLPLGSRIRLAGAESYDGEYLVTDTGADVKGRHIDVYLPSQVEAKRFGTKTVRVVILERGAGKQDARAKDTVAPAPGPDGGRGRLPDR